MFSKDIVDNDRFYDLPLTSQLLYFHLGMAADDDGFTYPKSIARKAGLKIEDLKPLIECNFVIPFESGVVVITDWKRHNYIRKDTYVETQFKRELSLLSLGINEQYLIVSSTESQRDVNDPSPQDRISKVRLGNNIYVENSEPVKSKKINKQISDKHQELANKVLDWFNLATGSKRRTTATFIDNLIYWNDVYTEEEIRNALRVISKGLWWAKSPTPELLFRRKNPQGERVDYLGQLVDIYNKETSNE